MPIVVRLREVAVAGVLFGLSFGEAFANSVAWPPIRPMHESVYFENARQAAATFTIVGKDNKPLYRIECHTSEFEGDPDFDYSGDFECRLTSLYSAETYSTLFTENPKQSRDWESRARFLSEELIGKCADYPEFGRVRHFRLRGMKITLILSDILFWSSAEMGDRKPRRPELKSFRFAVQVEADAEARTGITEPVPYSEPPYAHPENQQDFSRNCEVILERK